MYVGWGEAIFYKYTNHECVVLNVADG
jgi:hypothetical protein